MMYSTKEIYYFPVTDVKFEDLYDWSTKNNNNNDAPDIYDDTSKYDFTSIQSKGCNECSTDSINSLSSSSIRTGCLVNVNEQSVALFRHGKKVYGITGTCPHAGGPLHVGDIEDLPNRSLCVRCPFHGWKFDLVTGECRHPRTRDDLVAKVYPVKVDSVTGKLSIGFEEFSASYFSSVFSF